MQQYYCVYLFFVCSFRQIVIFIEFCNLKFESLSGQENILKYFICINWSLIAKYYHINQFRSFEQFLLAIFGLPSFRVNEWIVLVFCCYNCLDLPLEKFFPLRVKYLFSQFLRAGTLFSRHFSIFCEGWKPSVLSSFMLTTIHSQKKVSFFSLRYGHIDSVKVNQKLYICFSFRWFMKIY